MNTKIVLALTIGLAFAPASCKHNHDAHGNHEHEHVHEADHKHEHDHDHDHEADHKHNHEADHEHGHEHEAPAAAHDHGGEIGLHDEVAERFGVEYDTLRTGLFHETVRATGRIELSGTDIAVVSAPASGTVHFARGINPGSEVRAGAIIATIDPRNTSGGDSNAAAKAALDAAKRELDRLTPLYEDRLVTASDYNAAVAAYDQAKALYSAKAMSGKATAPISGVVTRLDVAEGQFVETGAPLAAVSASGTVNLRIDLPRKYLRSAASFSNAIVEIPYSDSTIDIAAAGGRRSSGAPTPDAAGTTAYVPVYFTMPNNGELTPGSSFTAYLTGNARENVLTVPVGAISEQQGNYFVYERVHPEAYMKRRVELGSTDGRRVEITSGVHPGAVIVTSGATAVRLAETGSAIPEGHSHNH